MTASWFARHYKHDGSIYTCRDNLPPRKNGTEYRARREVFSTLCIVDIKSPFVSIDKESPMFTTNVPEIGFAEIHCPVFDKTSSEGIVSCSKIVNNSKSVWGRIDEGSSVPDNSPG